MKYAWGIGSLAMVATISSSWESDFAQRSCSNAEILHTVQAHDDSIINLMQGSWVHLEDNRAWIEVIGSNWIWHYEDDTVASSDIAVIQIAHHLPECAGPRLSSDYINLISDEDTLSYELLGLTASTLSLMYCARGNFHLYRRQTPLTTKPSSWSDMKLEENIFIQDSTQYSPTFLAAFRKKNGWIGRHVELRGDSMIVEGDALEDVILLPIDLPLNKEVHYSKARGGRRYRMDLTRLNISTVAYHYVVDDASSKLLDLQGTADLDPSFYNGAGGDFEDAGQIYGMNKFHPNDTTCGDYLLIGQGSIAMASYIRRCPDKDSVLSMGMDKQ